MEFNIADLMECVADAVPEREAVVCNADRRTYAELDDRATRARARPASTRACSAGDHVGLYLRNSVAHLEAMLACYKARAVPINVNYRYVAERAAVPLRRRGPRRTVPRRRHHRRTSHAVDSPALLLTVIAGSDDVRAAHRESGSDGARLRPPLRRRSLRPLHGRDDRPPEGRRVAPGRHVLRRPRRAGTRAARRSPRRSRSRRRCSTILRNGCGPFLPPGDTSVTQFVSLALGPLMHASGQWSALGTLLGGGKVVLYGEAARRHGARARSPRTRARERVQPRGRRERAADARTRSPRNPIGGTFRALRLLGSGGSILSGEVKDGLMAALPVGRRDRRRHRLVGVARAGGRGHDARRRAIGVAHVRGQGRDDRGRRGNDAARSRPGVVGRLATRGRVPLGYHKDPERSAAHVRGDRRRAVVAARRHGHHRRRRHDSPARPGRNVHQHRRREGVSRRGRGGR